MNTAVLALGNPLLTILWMIVAIIAALVLEISTSRWRP